MTFHLGKTSKRRLEGVDKDIVRVLELAITRTKVDFTVLEGLRTEARQRQLLEQKRTRTMNSRHITGDAVDVAPIVDGKIPWPQWKNGKESYDADMAIWENVKEAIFSAADELDVVIQWGADWDMDGIRVDKDPNETFLDAPHWQVPWPYRMADAEKAQARRVAARDLARDNRDTDHSGLSPNITPGLSPEDMKDEEFDPGWPADLEGPKD